MHQDQITDRFRPHQLSDEASERITQLRHVFIRLAAILSDSAPESRENFLAPRKLEEATFWASPAHSGHHDPDQTTR